MQTLFGFTLDSSDDLSLVTTEFEQIWRCSQINEGQTVVCLLSEQVIQTLLTNADQTRILELQNKAQ